MLELLGDFTVRTVALGAALLGVTSGVLGAFAVLRQQGLLGDTLSHAALPGVCLGFLVAGSRNLPSILAGALLTGALAALLVLGLTRRSRLKTDAALGVSLSLFFAVGTVLLTFIQNSDNAGQAGLDSFLFGQAAALLPSDLWLMGGVTAVALLMVGALWKEFKVVTFDAGFAASLGLPALALETLLTVLIALAVVIGLQLVGVVLMAAMIVAPAAAARQWTTRLEGMVVLSAGFGALSGIVGAVLSAGGRGLSTGPVIVLCASALMGVSLLFAPTRGLVPAALQGRRNRETLRAQKVLTDLYELARQHGDPAYAGELGMLNALYGTDARNVLQRLDGRGLTERDTHMREEGDHWRLTERGFREAERLVERLEA